MKFEEFYKKLRELSIQYPGTLEECVQGEYYARSILAIDGILAKLPKHIWIKHVAMARIHHDIIDCLLLRYDNVPDNIRNQKTFVEALNILTQKDYDDELEIIVKILKDRLRMK